MLRLHLLQPQARLRRLAISELPNLKSHPPDLETQNYVRTIYSRYSNIHLGSVPAAPAVEAIKPAERIGEKNPTYNQIIRFTSLNGDAARSGK